MEKSCFLQYHEKLKGFSLVGFIKLCNALRDLVSFMQFKKREKQPWRNVAFSLHVSTPPCVFFTFFELYIRYQIAQRITFDMVAELIEHTSDASLLD